jgi:hypothetical protein
MKFLIIGDPIDGLLPKTDTGLTIVRACLARGHDLFWATPEEVALSGVRVEANTRAVIACQRGCLPETADIRSHGRGRARARFSPLRSATRFGLYPKIMVRHYAQIPTIAELSGARYDASPSYGSGELRLSGRERCDPQAQSCAGDSGRGNRP